MLRYSRLVLFLCLFFLLAFLVGSALDVPYLTGTEWITKHPGVSAAVIANALLVADVLLPVPSSLLMIANGTLLGLLGGSLASLASSTAGGMLAFWLGRRGSPHLMAWIPVEEKLRAERFFRKWGAAAVVMTRPVPILAESIGVLAGTTQLSWTRYSVAVVLGNIPAALLYAFAGATAKRSTYGPLIFVVLLAITVIYWMLSRWAPQSPS